MAKRGKRRRNGWLRTNSENTRKVEASLKVIAVGSQES